MKKKTTCKVEFIIGYPDHTWENNHFVEVSTDIHLRDEEINFKAEVKLIKQLSDDKTEYTFILPSGYREHNTDE